MFISLVTGAVIPWGKSLKYWRTSFDITSWPILDIGVLYLMGMVSIGVYGMMIGGWASNNKYSFNRSYTCFISDDFLRISNGTLRFFRSL